MNCCGDSVLALRRKGGINPGPGYSKSQTLRSPRDSHAAGKCSLSLKGLPKPGGEVGDALSIFQLNSISKVLYVSASVWLRLYYLLLFIVIRLYLYCKITLKEF